MVKFAVYLSSAVPPKKRRPAPPARARRKAPPAKRPPRKAGHPILRFGFRWGFRLAAAGLLFWGLVAGFYYLLSWRYDLREIGVMPQRSAVYDKDGEFYSRLSGENRVMVSFDQVSNNFINALITREDTRFYQHSGVDPLGIARAVVRNLLMGGIRQGASTITQQLARNSFPLGGRNFHRKLLEAALSFRIETELTKEEILEHYMNRIYFGSGYYGIETASQAYFGKPAAALNLSEAALMAGLIRSPTRLSPFNDLPASLKHRDIGLRRMHELGYIDGAQLAAALEYKIRLAEPEPAAPQENWAMDAIRRELEEILEREGLEEGGISIYTTLDPGLQRAAQRAVNARLAEIEARPGFRHPDRAAAVAAGSSDYLQAAAIAIDNRDGAVRAIVGGRDYSRSKFNRALFGRRQIGSAVKPFVYALAFSKGLRPGDAVSDARIAPGEIPRKFGHYDPANSDGTYGGNRPAAEGLIHSRNPLTVRVGLQAGLDAIADTVIRAGIHDDPPRYPAICLGAFESNLRDLTSAYTAFANEGNQVRPYLITRITDAHGTTLYRARQVRIPLLDRPSARMTDEILEDVVRRGTAASARSYGLRRRAAGKTGTTNDTQDAWFIGFTRGLTAGVWVGFDAPKPIASGASAAQLALPVWVSIMENPAARVYP